MCGRFAITLPDDALAHLFAAQPANDLPPCPRYNICPTQSVATVTSNDGLRSLRAMRWGFVPHWYKTPSGGPLLINARAETIATKPAFANAARARRCLIPASGFFEWTKDKQKNRLPWYICPNNGGPLAFAGIWQEWERDNTRLTTCAIVTCVANSALSHIHHRMPVVLAPGDWPLWLGEAGPGPAALMRPAPDALLTAFRVGNEVNSNRADGSSLVQPL